MGLKQKIGVAVGALLISGGLLAGAALANEAPADTSAQPAQTEKTSLLSEGAKGLLQQLQDLRKAYMEKYQAEAKALADQAVQEGKVTQEEADRLMAHGRGHGFDRGFGRGHGKGPGMGFDKGFERGAGKGFEQGRGFKPGMIQDAVKAQLDKAVAAGTITAEQAAKLLEQLTTK